MSKSDGYLKCLCLIFFLLLVLSLQSSFVLLASFIAAEIQVLQRPCNLIPRPLRIEAEFFSVFFGIILWSPVGSTPVTTRFSHFFFLRQPSPNRTPSPRRIETLEGSISSGNAFAQLNVCIFDTFMMIPWPLPLLVTFPYLLQRRSDFRSGYSTDPCWNSASTVVKSAWKWFAILMAAAVSPGGID